MPIGAYQGSRQPTEKQQISADKNRHLRSASGLDSTLDGHQVHRLVTTMTEYIVAQKAVCTACAVRSTSTP
jgi:hypothetical protein